MALMEWFGGLVWYWQALIAVVTLAVLFVIGCVVIMYLMVKQSK